MKITIDVTQECIDKGIQEDVAYCPIALAIRKVKPNTEISVLSEDVTIDIFDPEYFFLKGNLPPQASNFIYAFDGGYLVEPFSFELELTEAELNIP